MIKKILIVAVIVLIFLKLTQNYGSNYIPTTGITKQVAPVNIDRNLTSSNFLDKFLSGTLPSGHTWLSKGVAAINNMNGRILSVAGKLLSFIGI